MDNDGNANWNADTVVMNGKPGNRRDLLSIVQSAIRDGCYTTKDIRAELPSLTKREVESAMRNLRIQGRIIDSEGGVRSI